MFDAWAIIYVPMCSLASDFHSEDGSSSAFHWVSDTEAEADKDREQRAGRADKGIGQSSAAASTNYRGGAGG
jgi:hypothetical protein